jgi:hypothetical protein
MILLGPHTQEEEILHLQKQIKKLQQFQKKDVLKDQCNGQ